MSKTNKRRRQELERLRAKQIDRSLLLNKQDYPLAVRDNSRDRCPKACPKCIVIYLCADPVNVETKQGTCKMLKCRECGTIYRLSND